MRDIQIIDDGNAFNFRVSGAVIKENKIMLNRLKMDDFWTFVGGKASINGLILLSWTKSRFSRSVCNR